ncbi:MAG: hypothetical protein QXE94_02445 [Candidatus Bathyarchaeia archaeon]
MKRKSLFIIVFIVFLLLATNFSSTHAEPTTNTPLPDFLEKILILLHPNASSAELDQIRIQWANQLRLNQERIKSTNGAVLHPSTLAGSACLLSVIYSYTYGTGAVYNPNAIVGWIDYNFARLYTPNLDDEAFMIGQMSSANAGGDVYFVSKLGPTTVGKENMAGNYLIGFVSNDPYAPMEQWIFIGYAKITWPYYWPKAPYVYIGTASQTFSYIAVCAWAAGGLDPYNDVLVDCVYATSG